MVPADSASLLKEMTQLRRRSLLLLVAVVAFAGLTVFFISQNQTAMIWLSLPAFFLSMASAFFGLLTGFRLSQNANATSAQRFGITQFINVVDCGERVMGQLLLKSMSRGYQPRHCEPIGVAESGLVFSKYSFIPFSGSNRTLLPYKSIVSIEYRKRWMPQTLTIILRTTEGKNYWVTLNRYSIKPMIEVFQEFAPHINVSVLTDALKETR